MAKLKCEKHKRRVTTVGDKFWHKTGVNGPCDSGLAVIAKTQIFPDGTVLPVKEF